MSFLGQKRGYVQVTGRVGLLFRTTRQTEEENRSAKESMNEMKRRRVESAEYLVEEQSEEVSNENEVEADEYRVSEEEEEELSRENEVEEIEVIVSNETLETEEADEVEEIKESETEQLFRLAKKLNYTLKRTPTKSTKRTSKRTSTTPLTHQTPSTHQRKSARNSITRHYPNEVNQYTQSVDRDEKEAQRVKAVRRPLTDSECESADDVCQIRFTGVPKVMVGRMKREKEAEREADYAALVNGVLRVAVREVVDEKRIEELREEENRSIESEEDEEDAIEEVEEKEEKEEEKEEEMEEEMEEEKEDDAIKDIVDDAMEEDAKEVEEEMIEEMVEEIDVKDVETTAIIEMQSFLEINNQNGSDDEMDRILGALIEEDRVSDSESKTIEDQEGCLDDAEVGVDVDVEMRGDVGIDE